MSASSNVLITVAKRPTPGDTKTRLCPLLSHLQAANLYECFLLDTLEIVRRVPEVRPAIAYLPAEAHGYFSRLAPGFETVVQKGGSLGERLDNCLTAFLRRGFRRAVIMSSDVPNLPSEYLGQAFDELDDADVVLGPCEDGGYYLIGMNRPAPRLLREVRMSTAHVARDTLELAQEDGLDVQLLPEWYDVDDAGSLARLASDLRRQPLWVAAHTRRGLARLNIRFEG